MSDSIAHKLYAVVETIRGTTPATPAMSTVRHSSCNLGLSKETFRSEEIHTTRELKDFRHGNRQVGGEFGFELSYGSFDPYLEALLMGTWTANVLKVGTTRRSFTITRNFSDQVGGSNPFHRFTGCEFNKLALKLVAGKITTGSFGVLGKNVAYEAAAFAGSTFPAATTSTVMDGFTGSLTVDSVASLAFTELNLNFENGLSPNFALFDDTSQLPSTDICTVSGDFGLYFDNAAFLTKFLSQAYTDLSFTMLDNAGKGYTIRLPKLSLTGGQPDVSGKGSIMLKVHFQAVYDATATASVIITRIP